MRKLTIYLILSLAFINLGKTQELKDLFRDNEYPYYWFGIDYSSVNLIGDFYSSSFGDKKPAQAIKEQYFPAWNDLIKNEREKFNVGEMLRKDFVEYDTKVIDSINQKIPVENLKVENTLGLKKEDIEQKLKNYNFIQKEGVGVVLMAEYLNKTEAEASYVFVIFRISDRTILVNKRYINVPSGFGIRNYWAGSIYKVFREVTRIEYNVWKRYYK